MSRILTLPPSLREAALSAMRQLYGDAYVEHLLRAPPEPEPEPPPASPADDTSATSR